MPDSGYKVIELVSFLPNPPNHATYNDVELYNPWGIAIDNINNTHDNKNDEMWVASNLNGNTQRVLNYLLTGRTLIPGGLFFQPLSSAGTLSQIMQQTLRALQTPMQLSFPVTMIQDMVLEGLPQADANLLLNFLATQQKTSISTGDFATGVPNLQALISNEGRETTNWDRTQPITSITSLFRSTQDLIAGIKFNPAVTSNALTFNKTPMKSTSVPKNTINVALDDITPVRIPSPSGIVINRTQGFTNIGLVPLPSAATPCRVIFATQNGNILAYNEAILPTIPGSFAGSNPFFPRVMVQNVRQGCVYMGLTLADNHLYAVDFFNNRVDVFDFRFASVSGFYFPNIYQFQDQDIKNPLPPDYAPFNIAYINGFLYIAYAKQLPPQNISYESGKGNGYINVFNLDGSFVKRLVTRGELNAPWGLLLAPDNFGTFKRQLLVANSDGRILVYDFNGKFLGALTNKKGKVIVIDGLRGLATDDTDVFWTAGPNRKTITDATIIAEGLVGKIVLDQKK